MNYLIGNAGHWGNRFNEYVSVLVNQVFRKRSSHVLLCKDLRNRLYNADSTSTSTSTQGGHGNFRHMTTLGNVGNRHNIFPMLLGSKDVRQRLHNDDSTSTQSENKYLQHTTTFGNVGNRHDIYPTQPNIQAGYYKEHSQHALKNGIL